MEIQEALQLIEEEIKNYRSDRYTHTMGVYEASLELGEIYSLDQRKVALAALFHDFAKGNMSIEDQKQYILNYMDPKYLTFHPNIYHGIVASDLIERRFEITDKDIQLAILYHVTGHPTMNDYAKVLYITDVCEKNRPYYEEYGKEYFEVAKRDLNEGLLLCALKKQEVTSTYYNEEPHPWTKELIEKYKGVIQQ